MLILHNILHSILYKAVGTVWGGQTIFFWGGGYHTYIH